MHSSIPVHNKKAIKKAIKLANFTAGAQPMMIVTVKRNLVGINASIAMQ